MSQNNSFGKKILIAPSSFAAVTNEPIDKLKEMGFEIILNPFGRTLNESELLAFIDGCDAVLAGTETYNQKVLESNGNLKVISRLGVGIDNIDLDVAKKEKILVSRCNTSPSQAVAELVLSLFLNLSRKIIDMNNDLKSDIWHKRMGNLLSGKVVGVIGLGEIGKRFIKITSGLNLKYLAYDLYEDSKFSEEYKVDYVPLGQLLKESELITVHINSSKENENFIDLEKFKRMKKKPIIVNTSRGDILDEKALIEALDTGLISGVGLDVFKQEPYTPNEQLLSLDNVILTPHIAAYASEVRFKMEIEAVNNLLRGMGNE